MTTATGRRLKIGLHIPHIEGWFGGGTARWTDMLAFAQRAEELGFDSLWLADHLIYRFEGETAPPIGVWESWSVLTALAASTSRVELGTLVACTSFRNPALLAKMADTVDEISGGRLILGLGAGWHEPEYRAFGFPYDHRFGRFEEAFTIIRTLLREGQTDFAGTYDEARDCELRPRGPRPNGPPLMIGTTGPRMLRLTAEHADIWNVSWTMGAEELVPMNAAVDAACAEVGRDPATLERTACVLLDLPGRAGRSTWEGEPPPLLRSPEEAADLLRGYARAGMSHLQVWVDPCTVAGVEALAPALELLARD
jgi:probable F420-dependent oxidoreductase